MGFRFVKKLLIGFALALLLFASLFAAMVWWTRVGVFSTSDFDQQKWLNSEPMGNAQSFACYRGGMANDIKKRVLKRGMSLEEVSDLLGLDSRPRDTKSQDSVQLEYVLGMCSGLKMDYDLLHIYFDSNKRLTHAEIRQH